MRRMLICVGMLVALSCGSEDPAGPVTPKPPPPPTNLDDAVRLWQSHGIHDYTVDEVHHCFCPPPRDWTAEVRDGVVQGQGWTVEELFDRIRAAQADAFFLDAKYDAVYGYPTRVSIDWRDYIADDESDSYMSNLQPLIR